MDPAASSLPEDPDPARERIVAAGLALLSEGGREALTTRAVAAAAGVQAPAIYRLFGDKRGLLDAVAEHGLQQFARQKAARAVSEDPLEDLRTGWDQSVAFGLAYPAIYTFMNADPRPGGPSPGLEAGLAILKRKLARLAAAGLLRVSEARALGLVRAAGVGVVLALLNSPEGERDGELSVTAREAVIAAITTSRPAVGQPGPAGAAIALRASLGDAWALTPGERHLLAELLDRLAAPELPG